MKRWRRWTLIVGLYLALGCVVSVAVAWWFAFVTTSSIRMDVLYADEIATGFDWPTPPWVTKELGLPELAPDRFLRVLTMSTGATIDEVEGFKAAVVDAEPGHQGWRYAVGGMFRQRENSFGWPFRAGSFTIYEFDAGRMGWTGGEHNHRRVHAGSFAIHRPNWGSVYLPLRPVWLGLAGNSVMYAIVLAGLVATPRLLERLFELAAFHKQRARAGRCPSCGYPCGVSPVCTECGEKLA